MNIERAEVEGYRTCGRSRVEHGDCPGYKSERITLIAEVTTEVFSDHDGDMNGAYARLPAATRTQLLPLTPEDGLCPHCGSPCNLSTEPRPAYRRLSERSPDEIVRRAAEERERERIEQTTAARQADALEAIAAQGPQRDAELEQLRALVERQSAELARLTERLDAEPEPPRKPRAAA